MKKIGIDARFYAVAGPGRYVKAIIQQLEELDNRNEYIIYLRKQNFDKYSPKNANFKKKLAEYPWYSFEEQIRFLFLVLRDNLDLFYVPHFNIPVLYPKRLVTAIPDIIMHTFSTERGTTLPKPYFKIKKVVYKLVVWWAVVRSFKVIVPSKTAIEDFLQVFNGIPRKKYVLAYEGVDPELTNTAVEFSQVAAEFGISKPFLLYVSSMYEHKNVPGLISAYKILVEKHNFNGQLILVGKKDKFSQAIYDQIQKEQLQDKILMPGMVRYIEDDEVVALRKNAELYVFPSFKEGFSLTPMESQIFGLPCVISNIPIHKEIYGDSVAYFNPDDPENMAQVISDVYKNDRLKALYVSKGYELVEKYDWQTTAQITLNIFNEALSK